MSEESWDVEAVFADWGARDARAAAERIPYMMADTPEEFERVMNLAWGPKADPEPPEGPVR